MKDSIGLYIHIPFCKSKCKYCDFNSFPGKELFIPPYLDALKQEICGSSDMLKDKTVTSVFIGGGTPSLMDSKNMYELLNICRQSFNIDGKAEITIESNPGTLSYEKLLAYRISGINRLSIGLQAWQDALLSRLGRIHTVEEFCLNHDAAVKAGFKNINADVMFGLPGQNINDWQETIKHAVKLGLRHISCYSLKFEEGTPFYDMLQSGALQPVDEELDRRMYWFAVDELKKRGYVHYEISNFALPGYECRHNLIYWKAEEYLGLGAGAHSYVNGSRYNNIYAIEEYIKKISSNTSCKENIQHIDRTEAMSEFMILGLRLIEGISAQEFKERYEEDIFNVYGRQLEKLMKKQLLELEGDKLRLLPYGLDIANDVFVEFI